MSTMDIATSNSFNRSPSWCITSPPLLPENSYMFAFRLPLLEKIEEIRRSRARFHTFNHCRYCTRDLILFSLLRSDVFAIDRLQLLHILDRAVPPGGKFGCKGKVDHWLALIDIGWVATVEKLPVLRNRLESTEYFFLQDSLFKIFAHFLEDSCTEILDEVRCDLVNMLEDLKVNDFSFKAIITTGQIKFRNNLNKLNNEILPIRNHTPIPSINIHRAVPCGTPETIGTKNAPVIPILTFPDLLLPQQLSPSGAKSEKEMLSSPVNGAVSDPPQIGNMYSLNNFLGIPNSYSSPMVGSLPKMIPIHSVASQSFNVSPISLPDNYVYSKRPSKMKRAKSSTKFDPITRV
ncbi:hypothetical protein Ahia01_000252900 [Argonauta hians]